MPGVLIEDFLLVTGLTLETTSGLTVVGTLIRNIVTRSSLA